MFRSRRSQMFFKAIVIKTFVNFTEKTCVGVFFNKVVGPQNSNFIQKWLQQRFFLVKFSKSLRATCFPAAASASLRFPAWNFVKKENLAKMFSCEFKKFLRTSFDWTPPDDCYLCLSENFEKLFRKPLLHSKFFQISATRYSKKLFHKCFSRILCQNDK